LFYFDFALLCFFSCVVVVGMGVAGSIPQNGTRRGAVRTQRTPTLVTDISQEHVAMLSSLKQVNAAASPSIPPSLSAYPQLRVLRQSQTPAPAVQESSADPSSMPLVITRQTQNQNYNHNNRSNLSVATPQSFESNEQPVHVQVPTQQNNIQEQIGHRGRPRENQPPIQKEIIISSSTLSCNEASMSLTTTSTSTTPLLSTSPPYETEEDLCAKIAKLEEELALLRAERAHNVPPQFLNGPTRTVGVPNEFMPIFKRAEADVATFFSSKVEDPATANVSVMGEKYVVVRGPALSVEFLNVITRAFGEDKKDKALDFTRKILYDLAQAIGRSDSESFCEKMGLKSPLVHLAAGTVLFAFTGWGFVNVHSESVPAPTAEQYFLFYDHPFSFEAESYIQYNQKVSTPMCVMNAGYSAGWCSKAFGIETCAVELLCKARGDPCCRFVMSHPNKIFDHVRDYKKAHPELNVYEEQVLPGSGTDLELNRALQAEIVAEELQKKVKLLAKEKEEAYNKVVTLYT